MCITDRDVTEEGTSCYRRSQCLRSIGGFLADWNRAHLLNPHWTPHSMFHNAMSIMLAIGPGSTGFYLLQRKEGARRLLLKPGDWHFHLYSGIYGGKLRLPGP